MKVCEVKMIDGNIKKNIPKNSSTKNRKSVSPSKSDKYIVPMPGRSSWLLKSNAPGELGLSLDNEDKDFSSESPFDHSHHIMDRKFIID